MSTLADRFIADAEKAAAEADERQERWEQERRERIEKDKAPGTPVLAIWSKDRE